MKRVINFSGGKTSALMTILLKPTADDIVLFTDTCREHPATYKFIDDFEKFEGIKVHRAVYVHKKSPGLEGFDALTNWKTYLPNRVRRLCTSELKIHTAKRYLRSLGIRKFENYIGFRADEESRVLNSKERYVNIKPFYPLYEQGVTKAMVNQYWLSKPYTLEIPAILGNCDLCFLKGKDNIIKIMSLYPGLADTWIADEANSAKINKSKGYSFIKGISYKRMLEVAKSQKTLFDLDEALPAFSCSCNNF